MKILSLVGLVCFAMTASALAGPVCGTSSGSPTYESATTLGSTTLIVKPGIVDGAGKVIRLDGWYADYKAGICKMLGFSAHVSAGYSARNSLPAGTTCVALQSSGEFSALSLCTNYDYIVESIICQ